MSPAQLLSLSVLATHHYSLHHYGEWDDYEAGDHRSEVYKFFARLFVKVAAREAFREAFRGGFSKFAKALPITV